VKPSLILRTGTRVLLPLLIVFSVFELFSGHNEPGGGFVGGLLAAAGFALYMLAFDVGSARGLLRLDPLTIIGSGLLVAVASGSAALFAGRPFLAGLWYPRPVPGIGKISTVLLFDVGVYLVVLGTSLLIVFTLAEEEG
jgi:multicomponent Na+:H+ antiporter subunit B